MMISANNQSAPAVFFDRDGVLNIDKGYVYRSEEFEWTEGAKEAIAFLNKKGFLVFVVTNQSGVARGYYSEEDIHTLHRWMSSQLQQAGARIDDFYYCPHHHEAKIENYRVTCNCRKPEPGLIFQAMQDWPIDVASSFMIGDKHSDVQAASSAGIKGYRYQGGNLLDFVKDIIITK